MREGVDDPCRLLISFLLVIAYPRMSLESEQWASEPMSLGVGVFDIGLSCRSGVLIFAFIFVILECALFYFRLRNVPNLSIL